MQRKSLFSWLVGDGWPVVGGMILLFIVLLTFRSGGEKERRGELHLLNTIQSQISSHLDSGGQLPNNLASLSNAVDWTFITGICEYNQLRPPAELYTVLPQPIAFNPYHRSIFLVGSKSRSWPGLERGRWVVGVGPFPGQPLSNANSNRVYRLWIADKYLPPEIRSQLTASGKN
jgi:hypothetical protein